MKAETGTSNTHGGQEAYAQVTDGADVLTIFRSQGGRLATCSLGKGATPRIRRRMARLLPRIGIPYAEARELMGVNGGRYLSPREFAGQTISATKELDETQPIFGDPGLGYY